MNESDLTQKTQKRLESIAEDIAASSVKSRGLQAILLQGSVAKELADAYSDIELMCIWSDISTAEERAAPFANLDKQELFREEQEDGEWYSSFVYKTAKVDVCHVDNPMLKHTIDDVLAVRSTSIAGQTLLASIQDARALYGQAALDELRSSFENYPEQLAIKCIKVNASFQEWSMRNALLERQDTVALHHLIDMTVLQMLRLLYALNRIYLRSYNFKWIDAQLPNLNYKPDRLEERLRSVLIGPVEASLSALTALLNETLNLAGQQYPSMDLAGDRKTLNYVRKKVLD